MSRVIVLVCEGWRDSAFARGFLEEAGYYGRKIEYKLAVNCSGHDWVKTQFVEEVANIARFREGLGVIGLLDEDGKGIEVRKQEIAVRLKDRGLLPISAREGRCLLIPTRNIETWLYWLKALHEKNSLTLNETDDYKRTPPTGAIRLANEDCRPAGQHLYTLNHTNLPEDCPKMLAKALSDLREFLRTIKQ